MTVWAIMVFMLIIPEASIFHEKNNLEFCFYYWSHCNSGFMSASPQMKSMKPLLYKQPRAQ